MSVSNSSYIYNNDVVCHTYDLTNSTTKSFTISIYGICEFLGFANFLSTAISGSNQITKNKQYFINPSKLITKIESFGDIGFYTYYYLFSGLTNLKNLPAADKCKLPIPSTGLGTIQNKKLFRKKQEKE